MTISICLWKFDTFSCIIRCRIILTVKITSSEPFTEKDIPLLGLFLRELQFRGETVVWKNGRKIDSNKDVDGILQSTKTVYIHNLI